MVLVLDLCSYPLEVSTRKYYYTYFVIVAEVEVVYFNVILVYHYIFGWRTGDYAITVTVTVVLL